MQSLAIRISRIALAIALAVGVIIAPAAARDYEDHYEFEASLDAPYRADASHFRTFAMQFRFEGADEGSVVAWRLEIVNEDGFVARSWNGESYLRDGFADAQVRWSEREAQNGVMPYGVYQARMTAYAVNPITQGAIGLNSLDQRVEEALRLSPDEVVEQTSDLVVGSIVRPAMPEFGHLRTASLPSSSSAPQSVAATGGVPYTVYLGNLHSQTNLSDGGGDLSTCVSEQAPQTGVGSPTNAYTYAMNEGLDFLMTSEHNHMFDGSTSTNTSASPTTAKNLYQSGQTYAANFNAAHPAFLALAGLEWGVISNGGHMNIFNTPKLLEWEYNSSNQLIGDVYTAKSDYASLYTLMKNNGWIGQFNHPATTGQFVINSVPLAYSADGDQAMALCEVMNSSAFSHNTTETESGRSSYEAACNKLLEAGYHVAFSSDQDNHCANWGASYSNRTGVLLPSGQALNRANFLAALQARHVFASWDKTAQIVLTTDGGHIMGDQFSHSGALTLTVNYAPGSGRSASTVKIYQGVPGSNGTVSSTTLSGNTYTTTPANGSYFYYAVVTQDNGTQLYSAPAWVNQGAGSGDTTPPTVSASESGTSGTITLSATASDNVGVSKVEFYVDNVLKATDTASPYSTTLDSTTLANGSHSLVAKAYDAAGNVSTSGTVAFSVSNSTSDTTPPTVSVSESGTSGTVTLSATASDNVGVSKVEFYVDNVLKATDTASPYSSTLDSTTLPNGSHNLVAKAYDAAGNIGTSSTVAFSVSNSTTDTTPPTVSASESGTSGTITLSATASDNVGVSKVEFYVDNVLKATDTASPYSSTLDSTTLANGSHNLVAKAYDAAGNVGTSSTVAFSVSNTITATELITNGGFESGSTGWTATSGVITNQTGESAHAGSYYAWLDGYGAATTDTVKQSVTIPSTATTATLSFWLHVDTAETTTTTKYDTLTVQLLNSSGTVLTTLATYSNLNANTGYAQRSFDVSTYKGQTVQVFFKGVEDSAYQTSFVIDDVSVKSQ